MARVFLGNAFSLQMIDTSVANNISVVPVDVAEVKAADCVSAVGHLDTANVLSAVLEKAVPMNRISINLLPDDVLYVAQVVGGRLPEGTTTLPEGFKLAFLKVTLQ